MKFFVVLLLFIVANANAQEVMQALPKNIEYDKQKALLGKQLYFDTILSKDNTISCASCHNLELGGTDNLALSFGIDGKVGDITVARGMGSETPFDINIRFLY